MKKQKAKVLEVQLPFHESRSDLPVYVKINGVLYEKLSTKTVNTDIDLDSTTIKSLKKYAKDKGFVNEQEALRHIIREEILRKVVLDKLAPGF